MYRDISGNIARVNRAADEMADSARDVNLKSEALSSLSVQLNQMVGRFRI